MDSKGCRLSSNVISEHQGRNKQLHANAGSKPQTDYKTTSERLKAFHMMTEAELGHCQQATGMHSTGNTLGVLLCSL